jgi:hypothetical protein
VVVRLFLELVVDMILHEEDKLLFCSDLLGFFVCQGSAATSISTLKAKGNAALSWHAGCIAVCGDAVMAVAGLGPEGVEVCGCTAYEVLKRLQLV